MAPDAAEPVFPEAVVTASFDVAGHGVAAVLAATAGLPVGRPLALRVSPPDAPSFLATGTAELGRRTDPDREFEAVLVRDRSAVEVPPGTVIAFLPSGDPG